MAKGGIEPQASPEGESWEAVRPEQCDGEGQNRTADTTIFSRVLYQLSYLASVGKASDEDAHRPLSAGVGRQRQGELHRFAGAGGNLDSGATLHGALAAHPPAPHRHHRPP